MKTLKKMLLGMAVMMALILCLTPMQEVHAKDDAEYVKNGFKMVLEAGNFYTRNIYVKKFQNNTVENIKVKVSSKKVVSAQVDEDENGEPYLSFSSKKPGKAKITITADVNGKNFTCKGTVSVIKFQSAFTELKVNGKSYLKDTVHPFSYVILQGNNSKSLKLEYKLKPGWKMEKGAEIWVNGNEGYTKRYSGNITNGISLSAADGYYICLSYYKYGKKQFTHGHVINYIE